MYTCKYGQTVSLQCLYVCVSGDSLQLTVLACACSHEGVDLERRAKESPDRKSFRKKADVNVSWITYVCMSVCMPIYVSACIYV